MKADKPFFIVHDPNRQDVSLQHILIALLNANAHKLEGAKIHTGGNL